MELWEGAQDEAGPSSQGASSVPVAAVGHLQQPAPRAGPGRAGLSASTGTLARRSELALPCSDTQDGLLKGRSCAPDLRLSFLSYSS